MPQYFIDANRAGFYCLRRAGDSAVVMPLGIDAGKAVEAAREFVNLQNDGSTLDEGNSLPNYLNKMVYRKNKPPSKLIDVLHEDPNYLVWFYKNFDMKINKRIENHELWQTLKVLADDKRSTFYKLLNENKDKSNGKHVGGIGDTIDIDVSVKSVSRIKGKFKEDPLKIVLLDREGNAYLLISSCRLAKTIEAIHNLSLPQWLSLKVNVLAHGEYKGIKETKIKPIEISDPGYRIGVMATFEYHTSYSENMISEQLKAVGNLGNFLIRVAELRKVILTDKQINKESTQSTSYKIGYGFFSVSVFGLLTSNEIREIVEKPYQINLEGISLKRIEQGTLI